MDDLVSTVGKLTTDPESDCWELRKSQFKFKDKTSESIRDKRRIQLIEDLKRKRDAILNEKRGLLEHKFDENEDWMDWQDLGNGQRRRRRWVNSLCKNQLMLSEWLLDRPADIETNWVCVVCPTGRRTLVIAKRGCTRAYHKGGMLLAKFKSILPNGGDNDDRVNNQGGVIILDCIWQETTKRLYALDVLHWNNQPLLNCDANFRLYWLSSKLRELQRRDDEESGIYDVYLPPHCPLSGLSRALGEVEPEEVDGVLFFHGQAPYISGQTPLVGWLKPYMVPERLGVPVPTSHLALQPPEYESLEKWVEAVSHCHRRRGGHRTGKNHEKMDSSSIEDIDNISLTSSTASDMEAAESQMPSNGCSVNQVLNSITNSI